MTSTQTSDKSDYENYVIQSNIKLLEDNKQLSEEIKDTTFRCDELEEEISKEEQRRTYMKGLMHNLYFMKCESSKVSKLYESSLSDYYKYAESIKKLADKLESELESATAIQKDIALSILAYVMLSNGIMGLLGKLTKRISKKYNFGKGQAAAKKILILCKVQLIH